MDYELGHINQLYDEMIQMPELTKKKSSEIYKDLENECARIPLLMLHSKLPKGPFKVMVQRHHRSIYLLLNSIAEKETEREMAGKPHCLNSKDLSEKFLKELQQLSLTIRNYFPNNIDESHPISLPELTSVAHQLSKKIDKIISSNCNTAEHSLISLLKSTVSLTYLTKIKLNYLQSEYLKELFDNITTIGTLSLENTLEHYKNLLVEQGFNTPAFYSYSCLEIIKKRDDCQNISESYKEMLWIKKRLEQLVPYKGKCFHKKLPDIKKSLVRFIDSEISHLDNLEKIAVELHRSGSIREDFKVSFSVKELAFFIHLQVECGIIIEDKPKKIHEYIVGHYSSKETVKISEKSFKNAYYSHSKEDIAKVTAKLAEMLARAQQKE
ncbi:hypothetical protein [Pedobacter ginsenosidimutans]|nr:hypothetical protein [Pedobacter ginsenosidimutans]